MSKINTRIISILLLCSLAYTRDFEIEFETGDETPILDKFAQYFDDADDYSDESQNIDFFKETLLDYIESEDEDKLKAMVQQYKQLQSDLQDLERQYEEKMKSGYDMTELDYELHSYVEHYENEDFVETSFKKFSEKLCKCLVNFRFVECIKQGVADNPKTKTNVIIVCSVAYLCI
jgi:hypothetical protein